MRIILSIVGTSSPECARWVGSESSEIFLSEAALHVEGSGLAALLQSGDRLRFLYPATARGSQLASMLTSFFKKRGYPSAAVEIPGLIPTQDALTERGLRALVSILCGELEAAHRQQQQAILYDRGAWAAVANHTALVSQLFRVSLYPTRKPARMQPLPSQGNIQPLISCHEEFFCWLQENRCPTRQVRRRLAELPAALVPLVGGDDNGFTTLSPLGELCFEAHRAGCATWK